MNIGVLQMDSPGMEMPTDVSLEWAKIIDMKNETIPMSTYDLTQASEPSELDETTIEEVMHALSNNASLTQLTLPFSEPYYSDYHPCFSTTSDYESDRDDVSVQFDDTPELPGFCGYHDDGYGSQYSSSSPVSVSPVTSPLESRLPSFDILANSVSRLQNLHGGSGGSEGHDSDIEESERVLRPGKRGAKNILLWKFLLEELRENSETIRWVNMKDGTFKFMDTVEISKKWGRKKHKEDMNFEKLSRGIRHYYRNKFMTRVEGCRLMYKFNWHKIPQKWRPREL